MILTNIKISNLYCFENCEIDLAKRGKENDIGGLNGSLSEAPCFHYQKFIIISGPNASGKTAFGKILCSVQNFLAKIDDESLLFKGICDVSKKASVEIEFVQLEPIRLNRYLITFGFPSGTWVKVHCKSCPISPDDTLGSTRLKIDKLDWHKATLEEYPYMDGQACGYLLSDNVCIKDSLKEDISIDPIFLFTILKSFDPSIEKVVLLSTPSEKKQTLWGYGIQFSNGDKAIVDLKGNTTNAERFSKGTFEAIRVAFYIQSIRNNGKKSFTYYLDDPLTNAHLDLEFSLLNLLITALSNTNSQLFYTSHNFSLIESNFPIDNYIYLSKRGNDSKVIQHTSEKFYGQDLSDLIQNDVFYTSPSVDRINTLSQE